MLIKLNNANKFYDQYNNIIKVLNGLTFQIDKGEMIAIMGKSGSGKSTILNILGGLDTIDEGEYFYQGENITYKSQKFFTKFRRNKIGFIVQNFALIGHINVFDNVSLPLKYQKYNKKQINEKVLELLKAVDLQDKIDKYPYELSGGECQRVAIARALINEPELILADEPTGSLDSKTEDEIMNIFIQLNKNFKKTIIIVTHNLKVAKKCTRIINILDGKVIENRNNLISY